MKIKTFILTFLMIMSGSILFGQNSANVANEQDLKDAIAAGRFGEMSITLTDNLEVTERINIPVGYTITINLNGKTITANEDLYAFNNLGALTIKDNVGTGGIEARGIYNGASNPDGNTPVLKIESGIFKNNATNGGAAIYNYSEVIITGGEFYGEYAAITNRGTMEISNAFIEGLNYAAIVNLGELTYGNGVYMVGDLVDNYEGTTGTVISGEAIPCVARINNTSYASFGEALTAAKATTGDVTVQIYDAVEFVNGMELKGGNYTSITFIGKSDDAKMTINQSAGGDYIEAHGKTVAFENIALAKANPQWSGNSGHMGNYFSIQGGTATYTNCTFLNGACTSGGTATYNNCTFKNENQFGLWVYDDALVTVNNSVVDSYKGIKVYSEGETSVTSTLKVENTTFTSKLAKPAVAIGYAVSVELIGNTYNNTTDVIELDSGADADCEGITFIAQDANGNDIASTLTAVDRSKDDARCGVLMDGKIYTSVATAAAESEIGNTITLLYDTEETIELPAGVALDLNDYSAPNVTIDIAGTLGKCYISEADGRTRIYGEITGMLSVKESVVVDLYSGETKLATTTLAKPEHLTANTLGVNIIIAGNPSSSWNTEWHVAPIAHIIPNKAILYLDDEEMNVAEVTLGTIDDLGEPYVWGALTGVKPSPAMIGYTGYATLQDAINAAVNGDEITLHSTIEENVTVTQTPNVSITIDGRGTTNFRGSITVDGKSAACETAALTVKGITFNARNKYMDGKDAVIRLGISGDNTTRYTNHVTIENCKFNGNYSEGEEVVAVKNYTGGCKNITIKGCEVNNMHSLAQFKNNDGITIENCTIKESGRGMSLDASSIASISGCTIDVEKYGIRVNASQVRTTTIKDCNIKAFIPVVARSASANYTFNFDGKNTMTQTNEDGMWCVIGVTEYEENGKLPNDATGNVVVNLNDEGLSYAGVHGNFYVASIGVAKYTTFEAALNAVQTGETIELLEGSTGSELSKEIEFTKPINFTITGTAPNYALPVVTFQNAKVNISNAKILIPELDARQNATINVINSTVYDAGGNGIVKSYYNGAINIDANSTVYTMQVTTMGYITVAGTLNATWQTNVYGNGLITVKEGATFATGGLNLTGKDYSGRDNTDPERVGKPATIIVDGATLKAGDVKASDGADYSYNSDSYGINIGTIDGKYALLDVKNNANVSLRMSAGKTINFGAGATVNVDASTLKTICRSAEGEVALANNGIVNVTGASTLVANVNGDGMFNMNAVTLDENTQLDGAKFTFVAGENNINTVINGIRLFDVNKDVTVKVNKGASVKFDFSNSAYSTTINGKLNITEAVAELNNVTIAEGATLSANKCFGENYIKVGNGIKNNGNVTLNNGTIANVNSTTNNGTLSVNGGAKYNNSGKLTNNGTINVGAENANYGETVLTIDGTTTLKEASKLNINGTVIAKGEVTDNGASIFMDYQSGSKFTTAQNDTFNITTNHNDYKPVYDGNSYVVTAKHYVAKVTDNNNNFISNHESFAEAVEAAPNNGWIHLLWQEGDAPIAMNASLYGKDVMVKGTATVDWNKGNLYVGRGGEGDAKLTFNGANLTSASNSASTGIHVSGREKGTEDKYNGTVVIRNSNINLDYLINKGTMTLEKESTLTVKNGFSVGGRPASETESGADATATITLNDNSKVIVNNHNGMGLGYEALGIMNINSGSTFETTQAFLVTAKGTMNVNGGNVKVVGGLTNNGTVNTTGESNLDATVTGAGWFYMNGVTLDADTKLLGAKVRFASGTNNIDGSTINDGFFQVGIGAYKGTDANVDTENNVVVNVKNNAKIGSTDGAYAGWLGTGFYDTDAEKAAVMTGAKYVLNIENSIAEFGYLHVSNDGELNVKGNATEKAWYNNSDYSFYAGDFIINGTATFDATDVLALYTNVSCDNGTDKPGTLNIVNGTEYEAERHNGAVSGTNFEIRKTGVVNANADLYIGEYSKVAADAKFNIGGTVTALGTITNEGTITLTSLGATLKTPEVPEVTTNIEDHKVVYDDEKGTYKVVAKVYVAQAGDVKYESVKEALDNVIDGGTVIVLEEAVGSEMSSTYNFSRDINFSIVNNSSEYRLPQIILSGVTTLNLENTNIADLQLSVGANATVNIENATINAKLFSNSGKVNVAGTSTIVAEVTGNGSFYMNGVSLNEGTTLKGANVVFNDVNVIGAAITEFNTTTINGELTVSGDNFKAKTVNNNGILTINATKATANNIVMNNAVFNVNNGAKFTCTVGTGSAAMLATNSEINVEADATLQLKGSVTLETTEFNINGIVDSKAVVVNESVVINMNDVNAKLTTVTSTLLNNINTNIPDYKVVYADGAYTLVAKHYVAYIGETGYESLQEAFDAAEIEGTTIELSYNEGDAPISMNASLYGKNVTISGTATVDWNTNGNYWLFVGRGGEGNATLTFDNAKLTSVSNNGGIHVSGREKETADKYDGTLIIKNSDIQLTEFINRNVVTVEKSTVTTTLLTSHGRPADETESEEDATATFTLTNSTLNAQKITNGYEGIGIMNVDANSNVNVDELTVTATGTLNSAGNITGAIVKAEEGTIQLTGGIYTTEPQEGWCAENYGAIELADGTWFVRLIAGTQSREFATGWYWFSTYIQDMEGTNGITLLKSELEENGKEIKSHNNGFTRYYKAYNTWTSGLTSFSTSEMYMINTSAPITVDFEGEFVEYENRQINLVEGWNWIGYPVNEEIDINTALKNHEAKEGDFIKGKNQGEESWYFEGYGWEPSFNFKPGHGYMYESTQEAAFTFNAVSDDNTNVKRTAENYHWNADATQYPTNMTMVAIVDGVVGNEYEVAAFANGEVRGSARPMFIERLNTYVLILTIHGDEVEEVSFKYYDIITGEEVELSNRINYTNDAIVGSMDEPYMLTRGTTGIGETAMSQVNIYPNPTTTGTEINLQTVCDTVEVFNALGVKVAEYQNVDSIDALETAGIYVIRITNDGNVQNCRLVVK